MFDPLDTSVTNYEVSNILILDSGSAIVYVDMSTITEGDTMMVPITDKIQMIKVLFPIDLIDNVCAITGIDSWELLDLFSAYVDDKGWTYGDTNFSLVNGVEIVEIIADAIRDMDRYDATVDKWATEMKAEMVQHEIYVDLEN